MVTWPGNQAIDPREDSVTFDLPPTHHFLVEAQATSRCRLEASTRQHTVVIDEPAVRGGSDSAATPLETMLSSFLACLNVISHLIADEMGIEIDDLSMSLDATFDTDGIRNTTPTALPFPEIDLTMNITTSASDAEIAQLREDLEKRCPVTVILTQAGTKINATWNVNEALIRRSGTTRRLSLVVSGLDLISEARSARSAHRYMRFGSHRASSGNANMIPSTTSSTCRNHQMPW